MPCDLVSLSAAVMPRRLIIAAWDVAGRARQSRGGRRSHGVRLSRLHAGVQRLLSGAGSERLRPRGDDGIATPEQRETDEVEAGACARGVSRAVAPFLPRGRGAGRAVTRTYRSNAGTRVEPLGAMRSDPARESEHAARPWHGLRLPLARSSCDEVKDIATHPTQRWGPSLLPPRPEAAC